MTLYLTCHLEQSIVAAAAAKPIGNIGGGDVGRRCTEVKKGQKFQCFWLGLNPLSAARELKGGPLRQCDVDVFTDRSRSIHDSQILTI